MFAGPENRIEHRTNEPASGRLLPRTPESNACLVRAARQMARPGFGGAMVAARLWLALERTRCDLRTYLAQVAAKSTSGREVNDEESDASNQDFCSCSTHAAQSCAAT